MREMKLGIIGCGAVVELIHLPALGRVPEVTITSLADLNIKRARELKKKYGLLEAATYDSYNELIDSSDVDIVLIATPPKTHALITIDALKANKHVYCEKSPGTSMEDIEMILKATQSSNSKFMVGYNYRFQSHYAKIKELLNKGFVGKPLISDLYYLSDVRSWPSVSQFQLTPGGGDVLLDMGIHCVDLSRWLFGEVIKVYANIRTANLNVPVADTATVVLEHQNGAVSILHLSWCAPGLNSIMVVGTKGSLMTSLDINYIRASKTELIKNRWFRIDMKEFPPLSSYQQAFTHFINCIRNEKEPDITIQDGIRGLQIVLAAYESSESGKPKNV